MVTMIKGNEEGIQDFDILKDGANDINKPLVSATMNIAEIDAAGHHGFESGLKSSEPPKMASKSSNV